MGEAGEILVFGRNGQVASALAALSGGIPHRMVFLGRAEADLRDPETLRTAVASAPWRAVINAAAYTAVDGAEDEAALAHAVNAAAPAALAAACRARGLPLLHVSTNFIFDGAASEPYDEDAAPNPQSAYGRTKLAGEIAVRETLAAHVILRTGWVFAPGGRNFPRSVLAAARGRAELAMVADQWGDPTPARDVAAALLAIVARIGAGGALYGTYHFTGAPATSRLGFAEAVFAAKARAGGGGGPRLAPVATADFPARAPRPRNGRLDCRKIERVIGLARPDWRLALDDAVRHMLAHGAP